MSKKKNSNQAENCSNNPKQMQPNSEQNNIVEVPDNYKGKHFDKPTMLRDSDYHD